MISERMKPLVSSNSVIRVMFEEGKRMAEERGAENVFDFSIGNPNVPAPEEINDAIRAVLAEEDSVKVHGYMSNAGFPETRRAVADDLNSRFGTSFTEKNVIMTVGAGGALNVLLKTILDPGSEVIVFAPYFMEYDAYIGNHGGVRVKVDTYEERGFLPDGEALREAVTEKTRAVIINNPNNPTGVIYPEETIREISEVLSEKEREYGHTVYLVSDEPYRELAYGGRTVPFLTKYYRDTVIGYSYSKSLSLPGERIGYVLIPDESDGAEEFIEAATIANRVSGCVNAPSLLQLAIGRCAGLTCDVSYYENNAKLMYEGLTALGFKCVEPQGAFYLWVKAPGGDDRAFSRIGKKYGILTVPGTSFAGSGYVRLSYCVATETIERSMAAFKKLAEEVL